MMSELNVITKNPDYNQGPWNILIAKGTSLKVLLFLTIGLILKTCLVLYDCLWDCNLEQAYVVSLRFTSLHLIAWIFTN